MKLKIKVTKDILERSKMCGYDENGRIDLAPNPLGYSCAISLAIRDVMPYAYVERFLIRVGGYKKGESIELPFIATNFINNFDSSDPNERVKMTEVEFEIEIPESVIEKINIDEIRPLLENHPTLSLVKEKEVV